MNKYPAWLNMLVLVILLAGMLLALPNIYGSAPAVQLAGKEGAAVTDAMLEDYVRSASNLGVTPEAAYLKDARAVIRFKSVEDQQLAGSGLRDRYGREASVALTIAPRIPAWLRNMGLYPMSLGLDLRGGVYVLLEVDMATAIENRMRSYEQDFDSRLRDAGIRHRVDLANELITIRVTNETDLTEAGRLIALADPELIVIEDVAANSLSVRMTEAQIKARHDFAIEQNVTTLRNRVDELGVAEPLVQRQGADRIVVQLPGVQDPNALTDILTATATLEFRLVDTTGEMPGSRRYPGRGDESAAVFIKLDAAAGEKMLVTTQENLGKPMSTLFIETRREAVTRNGVTEQRVVKTEEVINTANIRGVFKNSFQISGLTPKDARDLALLLRAGALAAPVYQIDERTIGPNLGQDNIDRGFRAVQIGFLAVIVFMAVYYRWFGMIANMALLSNLVFIVALLSLLQASLTLPGIAGIVLTVGMAVDANVLIFERIREELAAGVTPQAAINAGYEKALSSIADANITTLIAAIVLFAFGTGAIKGFAITLSLGIITSMFTAIVGTRTVVNLAFGGRKLTDVPV